MPSKEIKELRQSGELEQALAMAQNELDAAPENIWGKRNISWVYYEYLKRYAKEIKFEGFIENLQKIKELNLPETEVMIFDTTAYQIGSILFKIQNSEPIDYARVNQILELKTRSLGVYFKLDTWSASHPLRLVVAFGHWAEFG